ncbi:MAG: TIGR03826 family flagellar region protein [Ignavibacteriales bacterium]
MEIRNCKRCGKMYAYISGIPICDQCKQKEEDDFQKVKKYIYENRSSSMKEISEACEVSVEKITRFLREGRLEIKEDTNIILECENCGGPIKTGRFCAECSKKLERELSRASNIPEPSDSKEDEGEEKKKGGGMRYLKS